MLHVKQVTGGYTRIPVIFDINFSIHLGQLVALVGLNGAGKSTLIHHMNATIKPLEGTIVLNDVASFPDSNCYKKQLAMVPETPILYDELTFKEHIELVCMAYGVSFEETMTTALHYARLFRLDDRLEMFPSAFSKGMKQKVMLILAFMLDVPLYIVDEPFMGLDPIAVQTLLSIFSEKLSKRSSVLVSTHLLSQIEHMVDGVLVMHQGKLVEQGTLNDLMQRYDVSHSDALFVKMIEKND